MTGNQETIRQPTETLHNELDPKERQEGFKSRQLCTQRERCAPPTNNFHDRSEWEFDQNASSDVYPRYTNTMMHCWDFDQDGHRPLSGE